LDNDNRGLRNPIAVLALLLVAGVIALIGSAVFGIDRGVLTNMADREYARGLITFLFAVVTIGIALVLVVSALLGGGDAVEEKRFQQGKEVLSLLLGVFGTILGYYFGSTFQSTHNPPLRASPLELLPESISPGGVVSARAVVAGGVSPYRYSIAVGNEKPTSQSDFSENGIIVRTVDIPKSAVKAPTEVRLFITDSRGEQATVVGTIHIQ
jgi:hypothetical protein